MPNRFWPSEMFCDLSSVNAELPVEDPSVRAVNPSTYFTSKDSVYLLAEE